MALLPLDRIQPGKLPAPWTIWRGADWRKPLWIYDPIDQTPAIDPTWTYSARLYEDYEPVTTVPLAVAYTGAGRIELSVPKTGTAALHARSYDFELSATNPLGLSGKLIVGQVVVAGRPN